MLTTKLDSVLARTARILVVAPHPDDETLGCGGLIAGAVTQGCLVHTLFVTDGGASHPPSDLWPRKRLAHRRELETEEALRRLGAGNHPRTFLQLDDSAMPSRGSLGWMSALERIGTVVRSVRPELVLLPWRRDPHCDHRHTFALVAEALEATASNGMVRLEYAIWLDELGHPPDFPRDGEVDVLHLDITDHLRTKEWALKAHATQLGEIANEAPGGFSLTTATLSRLLTPTERYYHSCG